MEPIALFNARGCGDELKVTSERARQLFRAGVIPIVALLNGKVPLTDGVNLAAVKRQRALGRKA